ncbi:PmoA family protein [Dysgonomonas sp. Marseille-P4677]|uniref:DUF6807 domain-containing protein n=1 Tax=Dysgonomonas sp. Marseille-P4677 TaxID=2364790 RepID=UPI001914C800|nr:PmoA family protein [Dysgonomonas sp. Marseille-P4677]MBK5719848.1 PmoA family protein [Dysgonomonas sp. Marseille-P4677]
MKKILIFFFCMFSLCLFSKDLMRFSVHTGNYDRENSIVCADISLLKMNNKKGVRLYETINQIKKEIACQLIQERDRSDLYWILDGITVAGKTRYFVLEDTKYKETNNVMTIEDTNEALILKRGNKNILQYNYTTIYPPQGVDSSFQRSGFIHPAYSPAGNILTKIQPKDHYHHYGIWNPWTRIEYDGEIYDLWNLRDKKGTVRAKDIAARLEGNVLTGYLANLDHYIFTVEEEKVIMNEEWDVKAWNIDNDFLWDFKSNLHPSTSLPVIIKEYRYGGLSIRATEEWNKGNCEMHTSEGRSRQEIDRTKARWIYLTGQSSKGRSGILFLSHPENYNYPEPLRIWDESANGGRGDAFINFAPTKDQDWILKPGNKYTLQYRVLQYDGEMTHERADKLWRDFAFPPKVETSL